MTHFQLKLEDEDAPIFADQVVEILNSALSSDDSPPRDAAIALDSLFSQDYTEKGTAGSFLWWFWDLIHDLARQVPYDGLEQERLVAVIKALHDLPPKIVNLGDEWGEKSSITLWTNLPMFGNTFYEKVSGVDDKAGGANERKKRAVNIKVYAARIAGLGLVPLEMYAIWSLVDALEGTMTPIRGASDEVNDDPTAVEDLPYKVKSAAAWMVHAGHVFYGRDEEVRGATAGPLWRLDKKEAIKLRRKYKGTDGLSPERWNLWKERFGVIRDNDAVDAEVRKEAVDAYTAMEKAEIEQKT